MNRQRQIRILMVVPEAAVKGGIASVVNGYREYDFGKRFEIRYVESYCDGGKRKKLFKALKGYVAFGKSIWLKRPDVVHIHSSFGPSFYRKIPFIYMAAVRRIPVINHIHGAEFDKFYLQAKAGKKKLIKKVYNRCSMLIALSDEWKDRLAEIVPENKIKILKNYCVIPKQVTEKKRNQILFLGEIGERKGCFDIPVILLKAGLKKNGAEFVFAGEGKEKDIAKIRGMLEEYGMSEQVYFSGWVRGEEKDRLLQESRIFLFPSYYEGMPMSVLEAMAYGLAVITCSVGGIPTLIEHEMNGYLCHPGDTDEMAKILAFLLEHPEEAEQVGKKSREKIIAEYSRESHVCRLMELYEEAVEGRT